MPRSTELCLTNRPLGPIARCLGDRLRALHGSKQPKAASKAYHGVFRNRKGLKF